jgi:hypothetical protein
VFPGSTIIGARQGGRLGAEAVRTKGVLRP